MKNYEVLGEIIMAWQENPKNFSSKLSKKMDSLDENEKNQWEKQLYFFSRALYYIDESKKIECVCGTMYSLAAITDNFECPDCGRLLY